MRFRLASFGLLVCQFLNFIKICENWRNFRLVQLFTNILKLNFDVGFVLYIKTNENRRILG